MGTPSQATVTIKDNDPAPIPAPTVSFSSNSYTVSESDYFANFNVVLSHAWDKDVIVPGIRTTGNREMGR